MARARVSRTVVGRVVYNRPRHAFSGRDMTRVVIAVNNSGTGSLVNWRAAQKIANRNVASLSVEAGLVASRDKETLAQFDRVVKGLEFLGKNIPAFGWMVELAADFYFLMSRLTQ